MIITKQFIKDLKRARSIVIRFNGRYSTIDVFQDNHNSRVVTYEFDGESFGYTGNWYVNVYFDASNNVLNTFIKSLRDGDKLAFYAENWITDSLKEAGFLSYILSARITRYRKNSETISSVNDYFIDNQTCLNNSALYIKPETGTKETNIYCLNS